jgi:glycosyltransferase involved in cell wall biosynthesis
VKQGCAVTVITDRREPSWLICEEFEGFEIRRVFTLYRRHWHLLSSLISHFFFLLRRGRQFDVWHVHQYGAHGTLAVLLGKWLGRPVALKLTNSSHQGLRATLAAGRCGRMHAWAHRRVDACIAVSPETAEEAREFGIAQKSIVILGNGVNVAEFQPADATRRVALRRKLELPARPVVVFVGRLAAEKNPLGLLEAWGYARQHLAEPWTLAVVGDGPLRHAVEAAAKEREVAGSVVIAGESRCVQDWLGAADLFVLSSHNEGMANTLLEAMACGLPSVVTAVSGMKDLIERPVAGRIVPVGDMRALGDNLAMLCNNEAERIAMGLRARDTILRDFSIESVAARHIALYRELLGPGAKLE